MLLLDIWKSVQSIKDSLFTAHSRIMTLAEHRRTEEDKPILVVHLYSYNKSQQDVLFLKFILVKNLPK